MTVARGAALGALALAGVLVGLVLLGGGGGTTYHLRFQNAGQLVKDDDVQVGGRRIGAVRDIALTADNLADITIEVDSDFAPLHAGTRAVIRATSLSGIANRYVALSPGADNAPVLPAGAVLDASRTTSIVDLDQLFATFDPKARLGLRRLVRGSATQFAGRGAQANQAAEYLSPALASTRRLVDEANRDSRTLTRLLVDTATATSALAARRGTLTDLVGNANDAAEGIVAENDAFNRSLARLPGTLRRGDTAFVNLRSTLDDLDRLVAASKPATRRLAPFLRVLRPLVADARPTIRDLRLAIRRPGAGNDLVELLRRAPRLARVAGPALRDTTRALRSSDHVLDFLRPYTPELVGLFRDFGQNVSNYDANGHYARVQPFFGNFALSDGDPGGRLTPRDVDDRLAGTALPDAFSGRCPGSASQPPADRSAPWRDAGQLDCNPQLTLPGP